MDWLLVAAFGIMWTAFLLPAGRGKASRASPTASVEEFERSMELLAETEQGRSGARWMVAPRRGVPFLGPEGRAQARARERRRRVFVLLLESIAFSFLIGLVPPLRGVWIATGVFVALLAAYVWLLIALRDQQADAQARARTRAAAAPQTARGTPPPPPERFVAEGNSRAPRPAFQGLGSLDEGDHVHVVVLPRSEPVGELHVAGV